MSLLANIIDVIRNHPEGQGLLAHPAMQQQQVGQQNMGFVPYANPQAAAATLPQQLQMHQQQSPMNVGVPSGPLGQGGNFNPGYTPLQNSGFGPAGNPQIGAYSGLQSYGHRNPQVSDFGYYWNQ